MEQVLNNEYAPIHRVCLTTCQYSTIMLNPYCCCACRVKGDYKMSYFYFTMDSSSDSISEFAGMAS